MKYLHKLADTNRHNKQPSQTVIAQYIVQPAVKFADCHQLCEYMYTGDVMSFTFIRLSACCMPIALYKIYLTMSKTAATVLQS